ncbi:hypothetical protein GCM10010269_15210 [Streptomyces humidus]|uniref:Bacterial Ig-like domain-containing protein n=1 Tax=Streptomyces humidus TaxID=52259 RepID=A0A918FSP2_9ACTN|nr:Ig-like domain-containing protein [Streptomyces humidus]GGR76947.1 hypothetical protein GCM10010269_15210 [Streptomyces humidus]
MKLGYRCGKWAGLTSVALATVTAVAAPAFAVPSGTTVIASPSVTTVNTSVEFDVTVTCESDPSGGLGVTFFDSGDLLSTVPVAADGKAAYTTSFSTIGSHTITAAYNGNGSCDASSGSTSVQVSAAPAPPTPTPGNCLLLCGGIINFVVGDITNNVAIPDRRAGAETPHLQGQHAPGPRQRHGGSRL